VYRRDVANADNFGGGGGGGGKIRIS